MPGLAAAAAGHRGQIADHRVSGPIFPLSSLGTDSSLPAGCLPSSLVLSFKLTGAILYRMVRIRACRSWRRNTKVHLAVPWCLPCLPRCPCTLRWLLLNRHAALVVLRTICGVADLHRSLLLCVSRAVGLVQNTVSSPFWDGATRIAQHYKFLLSHAFDSNPAAPYVRLLRPTSDLAMLFSSSGDACHVPLRCAAVVVLSL